MKRIVCDCDRCGKPVENNNSEIKVVTGRSMDPSGNGYCDDLRNVDLCYDCLLIWVKKSLGTMSISMFLDFIRKKE